MERLTSKIGDTVYYAKGKYPPTTLCIEMENWEVRECMQRNVGDIVYVNKKTLFDWYTFLEFKKYVRAEVIGIKVTKKQKLVNLRPITERACNTRYHEFYPFSSFGKTVFLTESEAKAELERRANE